MGIRGCGKTTLARAILAPQPERLVIIDTLGEWSRKGIVEGVSPEVFCRVLLSSESYRVGIYPPDERIFDWACEACAARSNITLAIEEMDRWYPTTVNLPNQAILDMALIGRHYGQSLIGIVHRPSCIHHSILSQSILWCFPMIDALDRKTVADHSRRMNAPRGVDPGELQVTEYSPEGYVLKTQVARVGRETVHVLEFDLKTGELVPT